MMDPGLQPWLTIPSDSKAERRWTVWVLPLVLGTLAALKTLRLPADWAITQSLIDYSEGFVKRGLLGELYRRLHWTGFAALQHVMFAELGLLLLALFVIGLRSHVGRWAGNALLPALFLGSYALSFLVHMVGYADLVNITLAIGLLLVRRPGLRLAIGLPLCGVAVLVHESFLLTQFPVVLFSFAVDGMVRHVAASSGKEVLPQIEPLPTNSESTPVPASTRRTAWMQGALLAAAVLLLTCVVSTKGLVSPATAERLHQTALAHRDLEIHPYVFTVLSRNFAGNLAVAAGARSSGKWQIDNAVSLANLVPVAALLLFAGWRSLRPLGQSRRRLLFASLLAAALCPLGMHVLGFDAVRWNVLCVLNLYLLLCVLAMRLPATGAPASVAEHYAGVLVLCLGMAGGYGLFDQEDINPYPYFPVLQQHFRDYQFGVTQQRKLAEPAH